MTVMVPGAAVVVVVEDVDDVVAPDIVVDVVLVDEDGNVAGPGSGVMPLKTKLFAAQLDGSSPTQMEQG